LWKDDILDTEKVPRDGSFSPVSGLLSAGKSDFSLAASQERQTARRLPEANAGCLSRNRRLFDDRVVGFALKLKHGIQAASGW